MVGCNANFVALDQLSPTLMQSAVWTWDLGKQLFRSFPLSISLPLSLSLCFVIEYFRYFKFLFPLYLIGEPSQTGDDTCVAMTPKGRWRALPCNSTLPYACQSKTNQNEWRVTENAGAHNQANCTTFGPAFSFSFPLNGFQSSVIVASMKGDSDVWISYRE